MGEGLRVVDLCKLGAACALGAALALLSACDGYQERARVAAEMTGGDAERGRAAIRRYGCGTCHTIPGVEGAEAFVGPPLAHLPRRTYIAGVLTNTPDNLVRWVQDPPGVDPLTAMPKLGVTERDARDIACYLYTLK
jgi:cytochrome c2